MKPFLLRSIFALVSGGLTIVPAAQAAMGRGFNQLLDAVVRIDVRELTFDAGARRFASSIGSGVILSTDITVVIVIRRRREKPFRTVGVMRFDLTLPPEKCDRFR